MVAATPCLVLIETGSNQAYIFGSNRLRENVGASELVHRAGTRWTLKAVGELLGGPGDGLYDVDPDLQRQRLLDERYNPPLGTSGNPVEVVVATSGKALLLTDTPEHARRIVARVTRRAHDEAPGLVVRGAIVEDVKLDTMSNVHMAMTAVHRRIEALRLELPAPETRARMLPVLEPCASTGLPACAVQQRPDEEQERPLSAQVLAKRRASEHGWERVARLLRREALHVAFGVDELDRLRLDKLAVMHADGNGLGAIFLALDQHLGTAGLAGDGRTYIDAYRRFSLELERATRAAFERAVRGLATISVRRVDRRRLDILPLVPLVLGGDDLTVVMDGRQAVDFAAAFLHCFEEETGKDRGPGSVIPHIARAALGVGHLSACAGIAVVRPHFPFHAAYELAESLGRSAKQVKRKLSGASAFDFHNLLDASGADLERIREGLQWTDSSLDTKSTDTTQIRLWARPYIIGNGETAADAWAILRRFTTLDAAAAGLAAPKTDDPGREWLPRSQQYFLREGLFLGEKIAQARLEALHHRYPSNVWDHLLEEQQLFFTDGKQDDRDVRATRLLDALELSDIRDGASRYDPRATKACA